MRLASWWREPSHRRMTALVAVPALAAAGLLTLASCSRSGTASGSPKRGSRPAASRKLAPRPAAPVVNKGGSEVELRFETAPAMYAANEEWLTFACELPDGQVVIGSSKSVEMYWYSRYALGNLLFRSGMGVHIVHNPLFDAHARDDVGMPWHNKPNGDAMFFKHKMKQFVLRTGADKAKGQFPPKNAHPIYLEFSSGVPAFLQAPKMTDFATLRWDRKKMDMSMNPGAWGQSMMKAVLWARDFFTNHKTIDGITYIGNDADDGGNGFRGAALTAMAITKSFALKSALAYHAKTGKLGGVDPKTYSPANGPIYYPHRYEIEWMPKTMPGKPPMPKRFIVTDPTSDLFDVASLLWAESEFYFLTDPEVKDDYDIVFGDPKWSPDTPREQLADLFKAGKTIFPAKPHMLAKGLTAVNFKNMMGLHFNKEAGTLVDTWHPKTMKGNHISMRNAGMALIALSNVHDHLHGTPLQGGAKKLATAQGGFLLKHLSADGGIANGFTIRGTTATPDRGAKTLESQAFAIRGLLAAYKVTGDEKFYNAAEKVYGYIEGTLYSPVSKVYRAKAGATRSSYTGYNFGATLGALRELSIARMKKGRNHGPVVARLDAFFERVGQRGGLQLAEIAQTGEKMPTPQQKAMLMQLKKSNPQEAMRRMRMMADSDKDGVPKPTFVIGTKFGAAPVQAARVTFATP